MLTNGCFTMTFAPWYNVCFSIILSFPILKSFNYFVCYGIAALGMQRIVAVLNKVFDYPHLV